MKKKLLKCKLTRVHLYRQDFQIEIKIWIKKIEIKFTMIQKKVENYEASIIITVNHYVEKQSCRFSLEDQKK